VSTKTKPRNKSRNKYDKEKNMKIVLRDLRMWAWESDFKGDTAVADIEMRAHPLLPYSPVRPDFFAKIVEAKLNWKLAVRVLCSNGTKDWMEIVDTVIHNTPITQIAEVYRLMKQEAMNAQQKSQIVDVGWIAHTFYKDKRLDNGWDQAHQGIATEERKTLYRFSLVEVARDF
jgi:hypothetical protein